jgi:hypothetical protein
VLPSKITPINKIRKIKKRTFAIAAAPDAIPVNPKIAAIIAITRNVADHFNIIYNFKLLSVY